VTTVFRVAQRPTTQMFVVQDLSPRSRNSEQDPIQTVAVLSPLCSLGGSTILSGRLCCPGADFLISYVTRYIMHVVMSLYVKAAAFVIFTFIVLLNALRALALSPFGNKKYQHNNHKTKGVG